MTTWTRVDGGWVSVELCAYVEDAPTLAPLHTPTHPLLAASAVGCLVCVLGVVLLALKEAM